MTVQSQSKHERVQSYIQLTGENLEKGGHYITIWDPRQAGKTWIMQQVVKKIREQGNFEVAIISMQSAKTETADAGVLEILVRKLEKWFDRKLPETDSWKYILPLSKVFCPFLLPER